MDLSLFFPHGINVSMKIIICICYACIYLFCYVPVHVFLFIVLVHTVQYLDDVYTVYSNILIDHLNDKFRTLPGLAGKIISSILEAGFEISMLEMFNMEKANAEEFYEVYKGVVQEYGSMVAELTSGPCLAMEIRAQNAPQAFREMVGPSDPVRISVL